ncbi:MAG: hypothetical protein NZ957_05750 [Thaumarchaeota archaeon]|nr:hypothetical protein [Candidatus Calditenuaceae archaeon]
MPLETDKESSPSPPSVPNHDKNVDYKEPIEEELHHVWHDDLHKLVVDSVLAARPIVFDLQLFFSKEGSDRIPLSQLYKELTDDKISMIEEVVRQAHYIEFPGSSELMQNVIFVNAPRVTKISGDIVGLVRSIVGIPKDIDERIIAKEVLYKCQGCGLEVRLPVSSPAPKCMKSSCPNKNARMEKAGVASEIEEVRFILKTDSDIIKCRGEKKRMYDYQHGTWYLISGIECEVTGYVRRDLKKNSEVEYWIEVIGVRPVVGEIKHDYSMKSLDEVRECYPQIVGEDETIFLSILGLASRFNLNKKQWIMGIVLQGSSSSGKSYIMNEILRAWKALGRVKELTRFTGAYLERLAMVLQRENVDNLIIAVPELFPDTPQQLHILLSERRLVLGVVDKDSGAPIEYEIEGQPFLYATTTAVEFREDLTNRVLLLRTDESVEQTKRIMKHYTELWMNGKSEELENRAKEGVLKLVNHIASLVPRAVVIPYIDILLEPFITDHDDLPVTFRRDFQKMINILAASAIFFQRHRPMIDDVVIATDEDFKNLLRVYHQLNITLTRLSPIDEAIIQVMDGHDPPLELTRRDITARLRERGLILSEATVYRYLQKLTSIGYLGVDTSSRPFRYYISRKPSKFELSQLLPKVQESVISYLSRYSSSSTSEVS